MKGDIVAENRLGVVPLVLELLQEEGSGGFHHLHWC